MGGSRGDHGAVDAVASCPDLARHLRAAARATRIERSLAELEAEAAERSGSLLDQFDRVCALLRDRGVLGEGWSVAPPAAILAGLFHECDLVITESLRAGVLDGTTPAQLAALVSGFVYERRGAAEAAELLPHDVTPELRARAESVLRVTESVNESEHRAGLPITRMPDFGFAALTLAWAKGGDLADVLDGSEVAGGDFVRTTKAVVDLLRQLATVAPEPRTARAARRAADALFRDIVESSSVPGAAADAPPGGLADAPPGGLADPAPGSVDDSLAAAAERDTPADADRR